MKYLSKITFLLFFVFSNLAYADFFDVTLVFMKKYNALLNVVESSDLNSTMKEDVKSSWFVGYNLFTHAEEFDNGNDSVESCEKAREQMRETFEGYIDPTFSVMSNTQPKIFEAYKALNQSFADVLKSPIDRD